MSLKEVLILQNFWGTETKIKNVPKSLSPTRKPKLLLLIFFPANPAIWSFYTMKISYIINDNTLWDIYLLIQKKLGKKGFNFSDICTQTKNILLSSYLLLKLQTLNRYFVHSSLISSSNKAIQCKSRKNYIIFWIKCLYSQKQKPWK